MYSRIEYVSLRSISSFVDKRMSEGLSALSSTVLNRSSASRPSLLTMAVAWLSFRSPKNFNSLGSVPTKVRNNTVNPLEDNESL